MAFISQDPTFEGVTFPLPSDQAISEKDLNNFVPVMCALSHFGRWPPTLSKIEQRLINLAQTGGPPPAERLIKLASKSDGSDPIHFFILHGRQVVPFTTNRINLDDEGLIMDQGTGPPPLAAAAADDENWPPGEWEEDDEDKSYLDNLLKQLAEGDTEDEEFLEMLEAHVLGLDGRFSDNKLDQEPLPYILSSLFFCLFYAFYRNRNVYTLRQLQYE